MIILLDGQVTSEIMLLVVMDPGLLLRPHGVHIFYKCKSEVKFVGNLLSLNYIIETTSFCKKMHSMPPGS